MQILTQGANAATQSSPGTAPNTPISVCIPQEEGETRNTADAPESQNLQLMTGTTEQASSPDSITSCTEPCSGPGKDAERSTCQPGVVAPSPGLYKTHSGDLECGGHLPKSSNTVTAVPHYNTEGPEDFVLPQSQGQERLEVERSQKWVAIQYLVACGVIMALCIGVGLCVWLELRSKDDNESSSLLDRLSHTDTPASPMVIDLQPCPTSVLGDIPSKTLQSINLNPLSPQARAYQWLQEDPLLELYSQQRKLQRFVLATLFLATGGVYNTDGETSETQSLEATDWMSYKPAVNDTENNECQWRRYHDNMDSTLSTASSASIVHPVACEEINGTNMAHTIDLSHGNLHCILPREVALLSNLQYFDVSHNERLVGTLPEEYAQLSLSALSYMDLRSTFLTGTIPNELCHLKELYFDCSSSSSLTLCGCDCKCTS